jgi:hypothetical protein
MSISIGPPSYSSDNLILFLDVGNPASYPGTGSTIFDISNNRLLVNNTATLGGDAPPTYSTDYEGFFFLDNNYNSSNSPTGLTGYIWPQASASLFTNGYTLSFEIFFRPYVVGPNSSEATILTVGERYYVTIANPSSSTPRIAYVASGGPVLAGGYGYTYPSDEDLYGKWHHMVFVMNANQTHEALFSNKLYINGQLMVLDASSYPSGYLQYNAFDGQLEFILGYRQNGGTRLTPTNFSRMGKYDISLFRVYNGEITQDQVSQNFNSLRGRYGI